MRLEIPNNMRQLRFNQFSVEFSAYNEKFNFHYVFDRDNRLRNLTQYDSTQRLQGKSLERFSKLSESKIFFYTFRLAGPSGKKKRQTNQRTPRTWAVD